MLEVHNNITELGTIKWGPKHKDIGENHPKRRKRIDSLIWPTKKSCSFGGKSKFYSNTVNIAVGAVNTKVGGGGGKEGEETPQKWEIANSLIYPTNKYPISCRKECLCQIVRKSVNNIANTTGEVHTCK